MKRKFLILTLCFMLIFTSINYKKSYADGGVLSAPILATVASIAVGSGIVIKNNDDLYDLGKILVNYVNNHNDMTMDVLKTSFAASYTVLSNGLISVKDSPFLDFINEFFDNCFSVTPPSGGNIIVSNYSVPYYLTPLVVDVKVKSDMEFDVGYFNFYFKYIKNQSDAQIYDLFITYNDIVKTYNNVALAVRPYYFFEYVLNGSALGISATNIKPTVSSSSNLMYRYSDFGLSNSSITFPYDGGYTWDNVESKKENESIALPIPGDLGTLVGQSPDTFWDNSDNLVGTGGITIPSVDNPSISVDNDVFVGDVDVPDVDVPDVDVPGSGTIVPSFPSFGDSLDFSPMYLTNVTEKFPFSLPWDIGRLISKFDVDPIPPVFDVPIVSETITLDLTELSELASIVRFFVLIGFILSLIFISTKLLG